MTTLLLLLVTQVLAAPGGIPVKKHHHLVQCVSDVITRYIPAGHPLVISTPSEACGTSTATEDLLVELHGTELWPVYQGPSTVPEGNRKHLSYVVVTPDFDTGLSTALSCVSAQVRDLQVLEPGNPKGVYVVALLGNLRVFRHTVRAVVQVLWTWKVVDVVVLAGSRDGLGVDLYSWHPFTSPRRCTHVHDVTMLDTWRAGRFVGMADLFPKKVNRDLNRCPLVASTMNWGSLVIPNTGGPGYKDGLEVVLYRNLVQAFNMTEAFIEPQPSYGNIWGDYNPDQNTYTGVIGDAKFGRSNVSFCGVAKNYFYETHVDSTHSYVESGFHWYVQCAKTRPRWRVLVRTCTAAVWTTVVAALLAASVTTWLLARRSPKPEAREFTTLSGCLQALLAVVLGTSVARMPLTPAARGFFCLWLWYCLALTTVFQTYFTSLLVDPGRARQVRDVREMLQSRLTLTFDRGYVSLFDDGEERERTIMSRWVVCPGFEACSRRTAVVGDSATVLDYQNFDMYKHQFVGDSQETLLCRLPGKISGYLITMIVQKGSPLFEPLNAVILRMMEAGLVDHWWTTIVERSKLSASLDSAVVLIPYFVFKMSHLYVAFTFLALGCGLGFAVFLVELVFKFVKSRPQ